MHIFDSSFGFCLHFIFPHHFTDTHALDIFLPSPLPHYSLSSPSPLLSSHIFLCPFYIPLHFWSLYCVLIELFIFPTPLFLFPGLLGWTFLFAFTFWWSPQSLHFTLIKINSGETFWDPLPSLPSFPFYHQRERREMQALHEATVMGW